MKLKIKILLTFCFLSIYSVNNAQNTKKSNDSVVLEKGKLSNGVTFKEILSQKNKLNTSISLDSVIITKSPLFEGCKLFTNIEEQKKCFTKGMNNWVGRKFNTSALKNFPQGKHKIYCFFIISKDGNIKNIEAYSEYKIGEDETLKVFLEIPKIEPGEVNGMPVDISYVLPITFLNS